RVLDPSEYENDVNMEKVALGIETAEQLLNWPKFKSVLQEKVFRSGINVFEYCEVTDIAYHESGEGYVATLKEGYTKEDLKIHKIHASLIVNATWQNIELLNAGLGISMPKEYRTNRLKALAKVKLPDELKEKNSMFFCMGPHCMFSNMS